MADAMRPGPTSSVAGSIGHRGRTKRATQFHAETGFGHCIAVAIAGKSTTRNTGVQTAVVRMPQSSSPTRRATTIPASSDAALRQAMALEGVPDSWQPALRFIMAQESGGQVDAKNPVHSARGLFQLTAVNYHLNPHGARSFGNAVEEAQGGIRYIQQRYGSADNAVAFWRQHHWY